MIDVHIDTRVHNGTHWHLPDRSPLALEPGDLVRMEKKILLPDNQFKMILVDREVKDVKSNLRGKVTTFTDGFSFDHEAMWAQFSTVEVFRPRQKMRDGWHADHDHLPVLEEYSAMTRIARKSVKPPKQFGTRGNPAPIVTKKVGAK